MNGNECWVSAGLSRDARDPDSPVPPPLPRPVPAGRARSEPAASPGPRPAPRGHRAPPGEAPERSVPAGALPPETACPNAASNGHIALLSVQLPPQGNPAGKGCERKEPRSGSDIVHPIKVDESGAFLSYDLSHRALHRRSPASRSQLPAFYELQYRGQALKFNLSLNRHLLAPGFVSERRFGGIAGAKIQPRSYNPCHMIGEVRGPRQAGLAALSTCDGLKGVFQLMDEDYFIEPVSGSPREEGAAQPHRIYKRQVPEARAEQGRSPPAPREPCGVPESQESLERSERRRERWEQKQHRRRRRRRIKQRSISREKWVETLVVADTKMVEFHGSANIEKYVLTVMNMVAGLFHHASIGNPINIAIVRLILLEHEEEDLKISHHADNTLKSFCKWQKSINVKGDSHPLHHDVAVLLTRKDICAAMNRPCETLGLSHVAGMCQPHRSCNINEDTGLPLAFTVAHELGHSFGIQHDGSSNDCEPVGKRPFIMSPQLLYDTSPLTWSRCSREYITRFLDRGWGLCLDDPPARELLDFPLVPPGVLYDVGHQCRLQYGPYSTFCDDMDSVCSTLWCTVGNTCHSKLDAAVDGTACGESKWCFNGECVPVGFRPEPIDGGWSSWSAWASCSRSCGAGVQSAERHCSHPTPKYGGRYCLGERKRFRICNVRRCPPDRPSFRQVQCSQFNPMLYKGKLYKWTPVPNNMNPCELHCRPEHEYFAEKLRDAVVDGTPCYDSDASRDVCINGICKNVGCDYEIDSHAVEDRCGVCHGDGSTCHTVHKTFEDSEGLGYVDIGIIPVGAREIRIEEVAEAGNFLALRSEDPEKYFLNGGWTIQWNGDYRVAGTTFTYKRTGNWENLTSPGPTVEPVWIQLLFQETNPGVRYQYTIQRPADSENEIEQPEFLWHFGSWTTCTATCGTGVQRQVVHCVERLAGLVEERFCDALTRPDDQQRTCSEEPCPARWWVGEWQQCSATCGRAGLMKRTVLCIQSVGLDEQRALQPADCQHLTKPDATMPCHPEVPCPSPWAVGNWSECSVTCGNGTQRRPVHCSNSTGTPCDPAHRPSRERACSLPQCHQSWDSTDWSGSGSSSRELFNDIQYIPSKHVPQFNPFIPHGPESNDVNVIAEEDFSARKGNVFVDDFYYDYNFINFHEDLSYYPFTEKESRGEEPRAELSTDGTEGPWEVPTEALLTTGLGAESQGQPGPREEHTSAPVHGRHTEPGGLGRNHLLSMVPEDVGSATPRYTTPAFLGEQEEEGAVPVPRSEHHPPTQSSMSPDSANHGQAPWDEPQGAVPSRNSLGQGVPAPWGPHPAGVGWGSARVDASLGPAARGSSEGSHPCSEGPLTVGTPRDTNKGPLTVGTLRDTNKGPLTMGTPRDISERPLTMGTPRDTNKGPLTMGTPRDINERPLTMGTPRDTNEGSLTVGTLRDINERPLTMGTPRDTNEGPLTVDTPRDTNKGALTRLEEEEEEEAALPPSPSAAATAKPSWEVGNWSECSATCGLGAVWRSVRCSSGADGGCPMADRPVPARRCSLRPCSAWRVGTWSKCSRSCGGGTKVRDVHCVDTRDQRLLRPFHCQAGLAQPPAQLPCHSAPCLDWYTSSWRECSEPCGGGEQARLVTCPEPGRCEESLRPNSTRPCNSQPCTTWVVGSWGQCSAPCGGGIQRRQVKCIDTRSGVAEEDSSLCDHEPWPESTQKCNPQECDSSEPGVPCERDRLSFAFCQTLRLLGRCPLPTVRAQCCRSCQHALPAPGQQRGQQRLARR
ncbi:A disintegrin and metalloproteinase with thrombospondin motifs 7 [Ammospiza caudacuta]|uniref:A disintegrin and metalloproteinase with thrombospondin motifs 7 n=1 Tax=Ammospiza caudacuta TaxID=2857398 RepID=UPI002738990C|nr:A disintegrin and metalloproteinase with thrombospondin motifs 7 [Ammospiza caudacuta]